MPRDIRAEVQRHRNIKEELLTLYPELADDTPALADTLLGETTLDRAIASLIEEALIREALADGIAGRIKAMQERKSRLASGAEKLRAMALWAMQEGGFPKLTEPTFTATVGQASPKVVISDEKQLPAWAWRITKEPNKTQIATVLKGGEEVPGATFGNTRPTLTVRQT